ncbi:MAG: AzlD domain-containing protein [Chloroflexi bacterium]|nr:AzlD domain-containing protein [Chloroflexota bacterium]
MSYWLIILGMVAVTYSVRLSVIVLLGDATLPPRLSQALRFVPPAALTAIIFPAVLLPEGSLDISPGNVRLLAALVAGVVAWRSKSALLAIGVGMAMLWLLQGIM